MNKDEILIIKPGYPVNKDNMMTVYRNMLEQMKTGLVLIPFGYEVVTAPKDIEVKIEEKPEDGGEEVKEIWCTECPYFEYVPDDMDDSWYGTRCNKDGHEANPSMYAVQSLHDGCPLKKESSDE